MATGCFISTGKHFQPAIERVRLAEKLGYASAWTTHINGRDALGVCSAYAAATDSIGIGTGVVPIYSRTPATMAQEAATIDDLSGGRFMLGIGVSHRPIVEGWHGQSIDRPVTEMREYAGIVRSILRGEPVGETEKWKTAFALGIGPFPDLPIYIAALSPNMLRLAGEAADGVVLWLCNPGYIRDVVVPAVTEGRERAGLGLEGFEIVAAVPGACTGNPAEALDAQRRDLIPYFGLPFYRAMLERSGFGHEIAAYDAADGDPEKMAAAISDGFLDLLCAIGDDGAVRAGLERYREAGATLPCLAPVAGTDFDATLEAGAPR